MPTLRCFSFSHTTISLGGAYRVRMYPCYLQLLRVYLFHAVSDAACLIVFFFFTL